MQLPEGAVLRTDRRTGTGSIDEAFTFAGAEFIPLYLRIKFTGTPTIEADVHLSLQGESDDTYDAQLYLVKDCGANADGTGDLNMRWTEQDFVGPFSPWVLRSPDSLRVTWEEPVHIGTIDWAIDAGFIVMPSKSPIQSYLLEKEQSSLQA